MRAVVLINKAIETFSSQHTRFRKFYRRKICVNILHDMIFSFRSGLTSYVVITIQFFTIPLLAYATVKMYIRISSDSGEYRLPYGEYDIPCDDVSLSATEDLEMVRGALGTYQKAGINVCRLRTITDVVDMTAERILRRRIAKGRSTQKYLGCGNLSAQSPLMDYLAYFSEFDTRRLENRTSNTVLRWKSNTKRSFVGNKLTYTDGRIGVNQGDFYFIYLSLTFREGTQVVKHLLTDGLNGRLMTFIVSIYKRNRMYKESSQTRLLDEIVPVCKSNDDGVTTIRIGSHIFLDKDDEVYVQVMDPHRLVPESPGNSFGIFPQR